MKTITSRLLFVEEDGEFLQELRKALPRGYCVDTVESGLQALQKLRTDDFDVIVADARLLEWKSVNLFQWVHQNRPLTICILLTDRVPAKAATEAFPELAFDYLIKPINVSQLVYSVRRAMQYRRLAQSELEARHDFERLHQQVGERIRRATRELLVSNEHLVEANRAKDQFLAAMSHELRTPLTAITGAVRILQSPNSTPAKNRSILEILDRNVSTLKHLLDDLLDCSRIASGKLSLELAPTNVNECVAAAVETMHSKASEAAVELYVLLPPGGLTVHGNPIRLQQIVWNLIDNAIKFTPAGGHVTVSVSHNGDDVELTVCDSGVGLSDEDRQRIFEPFSQVHESDAQKKGGLGLGLALVRNLTQMHNGSVRAESEGVGHGARFIVTLPLAARARQAA